MKINEGWRIIFNSWKKSLDLINEEDKESETILFKETRQSIKRCSYDSLALPHKGHFWSSESKECKEIFSNLMKNLH
jgi:hypothetical protein